ncbi:MAG: Tol-Pal system beta propeller repeat protein TolB [Nitrospirae bacterium]|nr:Tol-Pal system beta propeller repeat protein TolB [Nitrospirota bacterium]
MIGHWAWGTGRMAWSGTILYAALLLTLHASLFTVAEARVYIDITSPSAKKLPIAIYDLQGAQGRELSDIIRDDLTFTGLFVCIDKASYIEQASQEFSQQNWRPLGIEAVVKGTITTEQGVAVDLSVYDVFEGNMILNKQYRSDKDLIRQLAHNISNDIYKAFTGQTGMFRTKIAFVAEDDGEKGIYVMDWDGHRVRKLGLKGSLVLAPHWSADGAKIVYSSERGRQWGIYLLDFGKMTEKKIFASKGTNMAGGFSPKGDAITLSSTKDGTPDIYLLSLKDESVKKLTFTQGIEVSPVVSPDGSQIAFVSDRGGSPQIYLMRADGSDIRRITFEGSYNTSPAWSPSGDRIVFSCRRGKNQICIVKPDGSTLMQLTESGNNEDPSFSPEGRHITFSSDRDGTKGIYIMRANGEAQKKISPRGLRSTAPGWSPN